MYVRKGPAPRPVIDRLIEKIDASGDCWLWTAARSAGGYGAFAPSKSQRMQVAHRAVYEALVGPIPAGLQLDHLCRNRLCVNPDHLEPVTSRENTLRSPIALSRRTHCPQGHEYTAENTRLSKRNQRNCRTCRRAADRARYAACMS